MENVFVTSIEKVKTDLLTYLWELFCFNPNDNEIFDYSVKMEKEFETLKETVKSKKDAEFSKTVKTISNYIDLLIEKFKNFSYVLKFSYLKEKFELCVMPNSKLVPEPSI